MIGHNLGSPPPRVPFVCIVLTCKKEEIPLKAVSDQVPIDFTVGQSAFSPVVRHPLELKRQQWFSCNPFYGQCSTRLRVQKFGYLT